MIPRERVNATLKGKTLQSDLEQQNEWRAELVDHLRTPIVGRAAIQELLGKSWPPHILLKERSKTTDVILRFPGPLHNLPRRSRVAYSALGISLADVFANVVRMAPVEKGDTFWSQLAELGYDAYQRTWMHLFWMLYRDEFDPRVDDGLDKWIGQLEAETKRRKKAGRPSTKNIRKKELEDRYRVRLAECEQLDRDVKDAVAEEKIKGTRASEIPREVRRRLWKRVYRMRGGNLILGGEIFGEIPYGEQKVPATFDNPSSWKPHQLAVALAALDVGKKYKSVERVLRLTKKTNHPT